MTSSRAHSEERKAGNWRLPHGAESEKVFCLFSLLSTQRGKDEYKLAATSDGKDKKGKKKGDKDMDDLKKEVDLVSQQTERKQTKY